MAAFDRIKSGIPGMDDILDCIRMGDNVVWQVTDIDEFRFFALPFIAQAKGDGRSITYIRFAQHAPILEDLRRGRGLQPQRLPVVRRYGD